MSYPRIVAAIDAELERLRLARLLLTNPSAEPTATAETGRRPKTRRPVEEMLRPVHVSGNPEPYPMPVPAEKPRIVTQMSLKSPQWTATTPVAGQAEGTAASAAAPSTPQLIADQPVIAPRIMPARAQRSTRQPRTAIRTALQAAGALAGQVPATPVYVSAAQMRTTRDAREALDSTPASRAAAALAEVPTAEMLSRRWLSGAAR